MGLKEIDALDEAIIDEFQKDGRLSIREVARNLDCSEGSVRLRLKKMQDKGIVSFNALTDMAHSGISFMAFLRLSVEPSKLEEVLEAMSQIEVIWYVAATVGRFNLIATIATTSTKVAMDAINRQVECLPGVNSVEVRVVAETIKHDLSEAAII